MKMDFIDKYRIIGIVSIVIMWFVLGTLCIVRGAIDKNKLKTIEGELESYEILNISQGRKTIDILALKIGGYSDKIALYLNTWQDYLPLIEKFKLNKQIKVLYNDKGGVAAGGFNLHIYQIESRDEILIDYGKVKLRDTKLGIIAYLAGLFFCLPAIYVYKETKKYKNL
jgi:hypothetical protein